MAGHNTPPQASAPGQFGKEITGLTTDGSWMAHSSWYSLKETNNWLALQRASVADILGYLT